MVAALAIGGGTSALHAQDLAPRAYIITPLRSNALTLGYNYNTGELLFEGTVPITGASAKLSVPSVSCYRSFSLFARSANVLATLPYGVGTFEGEVLEQQRSIYRSGLFDSMFRVSVNLVGGPAMSLPEMRQRAPISGLAATTGSSRWRGSTRGSAASQRQRSAGRRPAARARRASELDD